jgi:hypothetical protein
VDAAGTMRITAAFMLELVVMLLLTDSESSGEKYAMPSGAKARTRANAIATFFILNFSFF